MTSLALLHTYLAALPLTQVDTPFTGAPSAFPAGADVVAPGELTVGDLDGDGYDDIVIHSNANVQWIPGTPSGVGSDVQSLVVPGPLGGPVVVLEGGPGGRPVAVLARLLSGAPAAQSGLETVQVDAAGNLVLGTPLSPPLEFVGDLLTGDWDGDGVEDLIASRSSTSPAVEVHRGLAAGGFAPPTTFSYGGSSLRAPIVLDVDHDGDLDIIGGGAELSVLENDGGAVLPRTPFGGFSMRDHQAAALDVDRDGVDDVLYVGANYFTQTLFAWRKGLPGGGFGPEVVLSVPLGQASYGTCVDLAVADFDGDGWEDWLLSQTNDGLFTGGQVKVALNRGAGTFDVTNYGGFGSGLSLMDSSEIIDLDLDGDLDVVGVNHCDPANGGPLNAAVNLRAPGVGAEYCTPAVPNGSGLPGRTEALGSRVVSINRLRLRASSLPVGEFGFFLGSRGRADVFPVPQSSGRLCLGGTSPIARFVRAGEVLSSGPDGAFELALDLASLPAPLSSAPVLPGDTLYFQAWHRDAGSAPASNFTGAVAVPFVQ